jgi:small conductance mechanosensitive channel
MYSEYINWGKLIYEKIQHWLVSAVAMLPNIVVAVIVLLLFILLARLLRQMVYRITYRLSGNTAAISGLFGSLTYLLVLFVGLFIALDVLRLDKTVSSLLAGAGIIGLALGFAFQDITANFISGIFITFRKPFEVGHQIETNGFAGTVENIQLRSTTLRTSDGLHVLIPNKDIFQKPIINHSLTQERRVQVTLNLPLAQDHTAFAQDLAVSLTKLPGMAAYKPPEVLFDNIDGANVKLVVSCWVNNEDIHTGELARHAIIARIIQILHSYLPLPKQ